MPESLEPRINIGRRIVVIGLHASLVLIVAYVLFFRDTGERQETISPAELREVVTSFRDRRRERMMNEVKELRVTLVEMRRIRDAAAGGAGVKGDTSAVLDKIERAARDTAARPLEDLAFHDVYDVGRSVEQDMVTMYREFLASRMVGLRQGYDYAEAYEASATPRPTRPNLDVAALYRDITTTAPGGGLEEFKAEIKKSTVEIREMSQNCEKLLAFTRKSTHSAGDGLTVDMSDADVAMIGYRGPELLPDEMDFTHQADIGSFNAIPGRRLVTGGRSSEWLYVDSWHIIGPFEGDRRRLNLDTRFGPEATVNLDDVFTGRAGRKIAWEYKKVGWVQVAGPKTAYWKIEPKFVDTYAIYYAFTELYSDAPRDIWIATGTDDYGKLWINDELVWVSPKERKPYNATENIMRVKLNQGQNKVLYRVENAGGTMGFSLLVRLAVEG